MNDNETGRNIFKLLPLVSRDIGAIAKDQTNTFHRYKFRGVDDVLNCCGPVLARHGVVVAPRVSDHKIGTRDIAGKDGKNAGVLYHCTLTLSLSFYADDGSSVEVVTVGEAHDTNGDKASNKAMAAAYKYAFFFGLCLPVDPDAVDDSDRNTKEPTKLEQAAERHAAKQSQHSPKDQPREARDNNAAEPKQTRTQEQLADDADAAIRAATDVGRVEQIAKGVKAKIEDQSARAVLLALAAERIRALRADA